MEGIGPVQRSQTCPRCGIVLKQSEWSASVSEQQVAHVWRRASCRTSVGDTRRGRYLPTMATELAERVFTEIGSGIARTT